MKPVVADSTVREAMLNEGSCHRLRAPRAKPRLELRLRDRARDAQGRKVRLLTLVGEYSQKCLAIHGARNIGAAG